MSSRFSLETIFKGRDQLSSVISKIQQRSLSMTAGFSKNLKVMDGHLSSVTSSLNRLGMGVAGAAAVVGGGLAVASKAGLDFEHTLASLAAVAKPSQAELKAISATALQVGSDFGFSAIDVAKGMEAMSKQGLSTAEVLKGISGVAAAASADGSTLDETMGGLLATMAGLGAGASDLQHISDVMAKAGDATAASIGTLSQSMAVFGPTARALGIPLESAIGQLAILQDAGIDASSAGTTLSAVYSKLAAPTGKTVGALKKLGLSVADSFGNMKPPDQLMSEIFKATSGIEGNVGKAAAITELVGLESQKALLNIAASVGSGKFGTVMSSLTEGVDGYSAAIAKAKQNSGTGDINKLTASLQAMQITIYGLVSNDLRGLVQGFTDWIGKNKELIGSGIKDFIVGFKEALPTIVLWMERIGKALAIFYAYAAAVKGINVAMAVFNALMLANPMTLLIYGIVAAIALIWAFWPEITAFFSKLWKGITDWADKIWTSITSMASSLADAVGGFFSAIWDTVKPFFVGLLEYVTGLFLILTYPIRLFAETWMAIITTTISNVMAALVPIGQFFLILWSGISAAAAWVWDGIVFLITERWNQITAVASAAVEVVKSVWEPIGAFFSGIWDGIAASFQAALGWVLEKLSVLQSGAAFVVDTIRGVGQEALGTGDPEAMGANVSSPSERVSRSISESSHKTSAEVSILDRTGRAAITQAPTGPGLSLNLTPTGAY